MPDEKAAASIDVVNWTPGVGVGQIVFGQDINLIWNDLQLEDISFDTEIGRMRNFRSDIFDLTVSDDASNGPGADAVHAHKELTYSGRNLIGTTIDAFRDIVGVEPVGDVDECWFDEDDVQQVYEFASLGAQVWVRDGIVVSICVGPIEDDQKD